MRNLIFILFILTCSGCAKKTLPFFQKSTQRPFAIKQEIVKAKQEPLNEVYASNLPDIQLDKSNLVFSAHDNMFPEKTAVNNPEIVKQSTTKLRQKLKAFKQNQKLPNDEPKFERRAKTSGILGISALLLGLIGFLTAGYSLVIIASLLGLLALILGAFSVKKVEKKGMAKLGITAGIVSFLFIVLLIFAIIGFLIGYGV